MQKINKNIMIINSHPCIVSINSAEQSISRIFEFPQINLLNLGITSGVQNNRSHESSDFNKPTNLTKV